MKILISDYKESMMPNHDLEFQILKEGLGSDTEIEVFEYTDDNREEFLEKLSDSDALLTAFIPIDKKAFDRAKRLKIISLNSTGYDGVDIEEADKRGIGVSPVGEYCTADVSEGALAFIFALTKGLKHYQTEIEKDFVWDYSSPKAMHRVENQVVGITGLGKIGKCTARKLKGLCKRVIACDPYIEVTGAEEIGVEMVDSIYLFNHSDIIINHMDLNETNVDFYDKKAFDEMHKHPMFINMSRGQHVVQKDLIDALNSGQLKAAGLDVLDKEHPDLENHPLLNRKNVLVTPHSSFYSLDSIQQLEKISSENIVFFLKEEQSKVFKLVNLKS